MTKPIFLNSKGDRGKDTGFETDDLEERYISAFASNYRYGNLRIFVWSERYERYVVCADIFRRTCLCGYRYLVAAEIFLCRTRSYYLTHTLFYNFHIRGGYA